MFRFAVLALAGSLPIAVSQSAFACGGGGCAGAGVVQAGAPATAYGVPQVSQNGRQAYRSYSADPTAPVSTYPAYNYPSYSYPAYRGYQGSSNLYRADRKVRGLGQ